MRDRANYPTTLKFIRRLTESDARFTLLNIGQSAQGREITALAASQNGRNSPPALTQSGKRLLLIQAGEIDGKDTALMLFRDIVQGGEGSAATTAYALHSRIECGWPRTQEPL